MAVGCAGGGARNDKNTILELAPEQHTIVVKAASTPAMDALYLGLLEQRIVAGLTEQGRFEKVSATLGVSPVEADLRLDVTVVALKQSIPGVTSGSMTVDCQITDVKSGKVLGTCEVRSNGEISVAIAEVANKVVTYVAAAHNSGSGPAVARTGLVGKWEGTRAAGSIQFAKSIDEQLELIGSDAGGGSFTLTTTLHYPPDAQIPESYQGCVRTTESRGIWIAGAKGAIGLQQREVFETVTACKHASYNHARKASSTDEDGIYPYKKMGETIILEKGHRPFMTLHPV